MFVFCSLFSSAVPLAISLDFISLYLTIAFQSYLYFSIINTDENVAPRSFIIWQVYVCKRWSQLVSKLNHVFVFDSQILVINIFYFTLFLAQNDPKHQLCTMNRIIKKKCTGHLWPELKQETHNIIIQETYTNYKNKHR